MAGGDGGALDPSNAPAWLSGLAAAGAALAGFLGFRGGKAASGRPPAGPTMGERLGKLEQDGAVLERLYRERSEGMVKQRAELDTLNAAAARDDQRLKDLERRVEWLERERKS